jgi:glucose-1-phosphate thymidylyltransferase
VKGLVLAAGLGTRLRPLTNTRPKPVIAIANRPLILHAVDHLVEAGVSEIGVVVSSATITDIQDVLKGYRDLTFSYIMQPRPQGLAHAVKLARSFLGDDAFVVYLGDNLFEHGITSFVNAFHQGNGTVNAVLALACVEDPRQFGVAVLENGRVSRLVEKPKEPPSNLAVAGVYVFDACVHEVIDTLKPSRRGEYEITDAVRALIESGKAVVPVEVLGWWKDTGYPEDVLEANRLLLSALVPRQEGEVLGSRIVGQVVIEKGAIIKNSTVVGPAMIGAGAVLEGAYIGPFTSIGANVRIKNAEVEYAVVEHGSVIDSVKARIHSSLIGALAQVRSRRGRPKAHKLMLGDRSRLEIQE